MWPCLEAVFKELDRVKWGHKGGVLIQYDQCTYKRRNWYQECARTEERTQSEGCHMNAKKKDLQGKPALTASWSWTSGLQNCEKMNYRHLSNLAWDILLCQLFTFLLPPSKLLYMVKEALPCRTLIYISCITLCHNPLPLYPPEISVLSVPLCVSDWPKSSNSESSELHSYPILSNRVAIWLPLVSSPSVQASGEKEPHLFLLPL